MKNIFENDKMVDLNKTKILMQLEEIKQNVGETMDGWIEMLVKRWTNGMSHVMNLLQKHQKDFI